MLLQLPCHAGSRVAPSRPLPVISGNERARVRSTRPPTVSSHGPATIGTAFVRCLLVRSDSPGLLMVHLRAAGFRVAPAGDAGQGYLRVHNGQAGDVQATAADSGILIQEMHRFWQTPRTGPPGSAQRSHWRSAPRLRSLQ